MQKMSAFDKSYNENQHAWDLLGSYFNDDYLEKLVKHQLESYNNFTNVQIYKTIDMFNNLKIASDQDYNPKCKKHSLVIYLSFDNFRMSQPQINENNGAIKVMFPSEARLRNFTYSAQMFVDVKFTARVYRSPLFLEYDEHVKVFEGVSRYSFETSR